MRPRSSLTSCSITATPDDRRRPAPRIGEAVASTPSSPPVARAIRIERRPRLTRLPVRKALLHRIGERAAVVLVDEAEHRAERLADRVLAANAGQRLGRRIEVVDAAVRVGRQQALAERVERELRAPGRRPAPSPSRCGSISSAVNSTSLRPPESIAEPVSSRRVTCPCESETSTSVSAGLASPASTRVTASATSSAYSGGDELDQRLAGEFGGRHADQGRERVVHGFDPLAVQEGRLAQGRQASRAWCRRPPPRAARACLHPAGVRFPAAGARRRSQGQRQASPAPRRRSSGPSSGLSSP